MHSFSCPQLDKLKLPISEGRMRLPEKVDQGHSQVRSSHLKALVRKQKLTYIYLPHLARPLLSTHALYQNVYPDVWDYLLYLCISFDIFFTTSLMIRMS